MFSLSLRSTARASSSILFPSAVASPTRSFTRSIPAFAPAPSRTHSPKESEIRDKLVDRLQASECDVEDSSGGCGTFYAISVSSPAFIGLSRVKQHRLVNEILKDEISGIHGLTLNTVASGAK